jgi:hypothetical protein
MQPKVYSSILILSLLTLPLVWTTSALAHSTRSSLNSTSGIQSSLFAKNTNKAKSGKGSNPTGNGIQPGKGSNSTGNGIPSGVGSSNNSNKGYKAGGSTPTGGFQSSGGSNPTGNGIPPGKGSNSTDNTVQAGPGVGSNNDKKEKPPKKPPTNNNNTGYKTGDNPPPLGPCTSITGAINIECDPSLPPVVNPNPFPDISPCANKGCPTDSPQVQKKSKF